MYVGEGYGGKGARERAKRGRGREARGRGEGARQGKRGWNNMNYLIKIITEDVLFLAHLSRQAHKVSL